MNNISTPCITLDQPLYIKAIDISKMAMNVVIRDGGFYTIMNFLGAVGHLMKGSGIEEVLGLVFGASTVEHVLSGKVYDT